MNRAPPPVVPRLALAPAPAPSRGRPDIVLPPRAPTPAPAPFPTEGPSIPVPLPIVAASPIATVGLPPDVPSGGKFLATAGQNLTVVAESIQPNKVSRKQTVFLTAPIAAQQPTSNPGAFALGARISLSSEKGPAYLWSPFPAIVPVEGYHVQVAVMTTGTPYTLGPNGYATTGVNTGRIFQFNGSAVIVDGWSDFPPPNLLGTNMAVDYGQAFPSGTPWPVGPVLLEEMLVKNQSNNPVYIAIGDPGRSIDLAEVNTSFVVAAQSTYAVGPDILGGYFFGPYVMALTSVVPTSGGFPITNYDATNGPSVFVDMWGRYLTQ